MRAVVFDLDDTLYPEREFVRSGFRAVSLWVEENLGLKGFFDAAMGMFAAGNRGNVFNLALEALGFNYTQGLIRQLVEVYRSHSPHISLYEDARVAILHAKSAGKELALLTDGYLRTQQLKVASLGVAHLFDCIVYSDQFGRENWKPSQVPYLFVMRALSRRGEECVYVGDNPKKDFVSAKALGWFTVCVDRGEGEHTGTEVPVSHKADRTISSLAELRDLLE